MSNRKTHHVRPCYKKGQMGKIMTGNKWEMFIPPSQIVVLREKTNTKSERNLTKHVWHSAGLLLSHVSVKVHINKFKMNMTVTATCGIQQTFTSAYILQAICPMYFTSKRSNVFYK
jgi:hypothetical protein